jgi:hypothetical protein
MSSDNASNLDLAPTHPPFSSLPLDSNGPPGNAWGRYGTADQLGTLNLLRPPVVAAAANEVVSGVRISLDWPLNKPSYPSYGRDPCTHKIKQRGGPDRVVNDDILTFNTQSSTQWDGFRHYGLLASIYCLNMAGLSCDLANPNERVFKRATILQQYHPRPDSLIFYARHRWCAFLLILPRHSP